MFYVYFLKSLSGHKQFYVGYTTDINRRITEHNSGVVPSTKPYIPWEIIFYEAYKNMADAKRREKYFKSTKGRKALKIMLRGSLRE